MNKIKTNIKFQTENFEEFPEMNIDLKKETIKLKKNINIVKYKKKKKNFDASTKID